ncbi:NAD(P)H-dependent oxidoreductase [Salininema proteolyticum]|uniref:NAD(P)H-dependent oxidoreductase n=1 Tax=Salininema proteolyticum TaxID=1607685 RepID=UPI003626EADE
MQATARFSPGPWAEAPSCPREEQGRPGGRQRGLLEADLVILQFPLWWFSMPAILKGWIDRVFTRDFAYGSLPRYGNGPLAGKKALVTTFTGGAESHFGERGVNGGIEDLLHHVLHGTLYFTGFAVLPPFVTHSAVHVNDDQYAAIAERYRKRLIGIESDEPIPYRAEAGGDYDEARQLKPGREASGRSGLQLHRKS